MWFKLISALVAIGGLAPLLMQLAGPDANVELSKETTFITEPLAEDGLPNYALAIMEREAKGVTPDTNGAVLFWQGMGASEIGAEDFDRLCGNIGLEFSMCHAAYDGPGSDAFERKISAWLSSTSSDSAQEADEGRAKAYVLAAMQSTPWSDAAIPPAAEWLAENHVRLDLVVAAAKKPRFFSPSPNALNDPTIAVLDLDLFHLHRMRDATRALLTRAMNRIDAEDFAGAWQDIAACWKLAAHASRGPSLIHFLMAVAIRKSAGDATLVLLSRQELSPDTLNKIASEFHAFSTLETLPGLIDFGERSYALDFVLRFHTNRLGGLDDEMIKSLGGIRVIPSQLSDLLRVQNEWCDRFVGAARIPELAKRRDERKRLIQKLKGDYHEAAANGFANLQNPESDSHLVAAALAYFQFTSLEAVFYAFDRDEVRNTLLHIAVELAKQRARTGAYPDNLVDLSPITIDAIPDDPYTNKPFQYARRDDGYILYSVFENGKDDGGTDCSGEIVSGEWLPYGEKSDIAYSESDAVLRSPRLQFDRSQLHR